METLTISQEELNRLPYADEEIKSTFGYPGRTCSYPEGWQLKRGGTILEELTDPSLPFTHCDPDPVSKWLRGDDSAIPDGQRLRVLAVQGMVSEEGITDRWGRPLHFCDGVAIVPKITSAVKAEPGQLVQAYSPATVLMTELMAKRREDWCNYQEGRLDPERLRLIERTRKALAQREADTPGDFLILPVQTGLRHRGKSARRARVIFAGNEWGLGPYETGITLLVHPERLQKREHLRIDCAGCEYSPLASGEFSVYLRFYWDSGKLGFDFNWIIGASQDFGSASALG